MKMIFIGCYCEESKKDYLFKITDGHISISASTFQEAVLDGLAKNNYTPDYIVNLPAIGSFPKRCKKLYVKGGSFEYKSGKGYNCSFINLTYFKRFFCEWSIRAQLKQIIKKIEKQEDIVILSYSLMFPLLSPIVKIKKKYTDRKIKVVTIVPDMPEFIDHPKYVGSLYRLSTYIDGFVLLTEQMAEKLNVKKRPYEVMEGPYRCNQTEKPTPLTNRQKAFFYSGTLDAWYGVIQLLEAFTQVRNTSYKLWICGSGTPQEIEDINKYVRKDSRIEYLGILKRDEVVDLQKKASFLVNPRNCSREFTKYSFPSKTMEYLASGTPTLMFPLPGAPREYFDYVVLFDEKEPHTIKEIIEKVISSDYSIYEDLGRKAQRFIFDNKTSEKQTKKIIKVIESVRGRRYGEQ